SSLTTCSPSPTQPFLLSRSPSSKDLGTLPAGSAPTTSVPLPRRPEARRESPGSGMPVPSSWGLQPGSLYDTCIRSLDQTLSELDQGLQTSKKRSFCARAGLNPGTPSFAACVETG